MKILVFGLGKIAADLLVKLSRESSIEVVGAIGRQRGSAAEPVCETLGIPVYLGAHSDLKSLLQSVHVDWVIDCSSAQANEETLRIMESFPGSRVLDLTPSRASFAALPPFDKSVAAENRHIGLVSCGAQAAIPVLRELSKVGQMARIELVSSLASDSVGVATRENLDDYIEKTTTALELFAPSAKTVLIVNPVRPPIPMLVSLYVQFEDTSIGSREIKLQLKKGFSRIRKMLPGYKLSNPVQVVNDHYLINFSLEGAGDYLPRYSGNLDVITAAAAKFLNSASERKRLDG